MTLCPAVDGGAFLSHLRARGLLRRCL